MQVDTDFSNDLDVRVMLLVHDTRPPFLDGRVIFTKQAEAIMPLRDPTSDLAVIAKSGSKLVKEIRDKKNEGKSRQRFWEVAGSKMGKITGWALPFAIHHVGVSKTSSKLPFLTSVSTTLDMSSRWALLRLLGCCRQPQKPSGYKATLNGIHCSSFSSARATCRHALIC